MSDFWRDRPVLVTGAAGFLGGWLTERLVELGAEVICLIRDGSLSEKFVKAFDGTLIWGCVTDQTLLERVLGEYNVRTVFHLAAQAQVGVANRNPVSTFDSNIRGAWSVLEACRRSPLIEQVVTASSDKAYGNQPKLPYTEDTPLLAVYPYDASKACADRLAQSYGSIWGLPVAITRCGNLFGGGDRNWSRLIPGTIQRLLKGERPVIHGNGQAIRDWLYIEDAVDAYLRLAENMVEPMTKGAYNLSLQMRLTTLEVVRAVTEAVGVDLTPIVGEPHVGEISAQSLDCSKARDALGWQPKHTFAEGLLKTVAWYRENL